MVGVTLPQSPIRQKSFITESINTDFVEFLKNETDFT